MGMGMNMNNECILSQSLYSAALLRFSVTSQRLTEVLESTKPSGELISTLQAI
jgi:hypothetical protein